MAALALGGRRRSSWAALILLAVLAGACSRHATPALTEGVDLTGAPFGGPFTLTRASGKPFDTRSLRGDVVALYFGYTRCTDVCVPTLHRLLEARQALGAAGARTRIVFVTIDPAFDTPAHLRDFERSHPGLIALTGTSAEIGRVLKQYKVPVSENAGAPPAERFVHGDGIYLEDASGRLRWYASGSSTPSVLAADLRALMDTSRE